MLPAYDEAVWRDPEPKGGVLGLSAGARSGPGEPVMARQALEARLASLWRDLREAHGDYGVDEARFAAHVASVLDRMEGEPLERVGDLVHEDIYLALGCLARHPRATRDFIERFGGYLRHLCRAKAPGSAADDIEQQLLETLFLPRDPSDPDSARLASYEGRGTLQGWLRVIAHRAVIDLVRRQRRYGDDDALERIATPEPSAAQRLESLEAAARLKPVFEACLAELDPDEVTLLRRRFLEGRVLRELADELGIDTSNAYRRVKAVQVKIFRRFRARAQEDLGLGDGDLRALLAQLADALELRDLFAAAVVALLVLGHVPGLTG